MVAYYSAVAYGIIIATAACMTPGQKHNMYYRYCRRTMPMIRQEHQQHLATESSKKTSYMCIYIQVPDREIGIKAILGDSNNNNNNNKQNTSAGSRGISIIKQHTDVRYA